MNISSRNQTMTAVLGRRCSGFFERKSGENLSAGLPRPELHKAFLSINYCTLCKFNATGVLQDPDPDPTSLDVIIDFITPI